MVLDEFAPSLSRMELFTLTLNSCFYPPEKLSTPHPALSNLHLHLSWGAIPKPGLIFQIFLSPLTAVVRGSAMRNPRGPSFLPIREWVVQREEEAHGILLDSIAFSNLVHASALRDPSVILTTQRHS